MEGAMPNRESELPSNPIVEVVLNDIANKKRCEHELANGTAGEHFRDFCPNAFTLDALFDLKG
jgi:hypothetical protein